jgi:lysozyme
MALSNRISTDRIEGGTTMPELNTIIDLSHHNKSVDLATVKTTEITAIIHKATQGTNFVDPRYQERKAQALKLGFLWGSYHFGTGVNSIAQADHFLEVVKPGPQDLLVLDFEENPKGTTMDLLQAHNFVEHIYNCIGRYPGLYSGIHVKTLVGQKQKDLVLTKCWLWLSQYGPKAVVPPTWDYWTMWQYTDGVKGPHPHSVDGIGCCDRSKFNGDLDHLRKLWRASE